MGRPIRCTDSGIENLSLIFSETNLPGVFVIEPRLLEDERGFFARTWCRQEFKEHGLDTRLCQCSISFNHRKGTLRGMHYQSVPHAETKLMRCTRGSVYDVALDLRNDSATFGLYFAVTLSAENRKMLYVPEGVAHGFQTLEDNSEIFYQISEFYAPEATRGVRWNDPAFHIEWPADERLISPRDQNYADFTTQQDRQP